MLRTLLPLLLLACDDHEPATIGFVPHCVSAESPLAHDAASPSGITPDEAAARLSGLLAAGDGMTAQLQVSGEGARWIDQSEAPIPPNAVVASIAVICDDQVALSGALTLTRADGAVLLTLPVTVRIGADQRAQVQGDLGPVDVAALWGTVDTSAYTEVVQGVYGDISPEGALSLTISQSGTQTSDAAIERSVLRAITMQ